MSDRLVAEQIRRHDEPTAWVWRRWWVLLWLVNVVAMIAMTFTLPPRTSLPILTVTFGAMEGFALWHGARHFPDQRTRYLAPYPPLTYTARYYLPRWLTYALTGFLTGAAAAYWFGMGAPYRLGGLMAVFAWLIEHWEVTYREMPAPL